MSAESQIALPSDLPNFTPDASVSSGGGHQVDVHALDLVGSGRRAVRPPLVRSCRSATRCTHGLR